MTEQNKAPVAPSVQVDEYTKVDELAKRALKARKAAPVSCGVSDSRVPQKEILKRLDAQQGGADVKGGMHRLFIPQKQLTAYAHNGYVPCRENGDVVTFQSDIAVEIPTEFYEDELQRNKALDARRWGKFKKEQAQAAAEGGVGDEFAIPDKAES